MLTSKARLRGLKFLQPAQAGFVCIAAPLRVPDCSEGIDSGYINNKDSRKIPSLMIGTTLNSRYHIIRSLGQGGFGATFIAEDRWQNNQHCVIKQLKPDALSPATLYLFEKEAEFLFKLGSHPQIPQLLAHFQENSIFYIVQELVDGNDLNHEIKRGQRLGETQVIKLLIEILEVLEYVHQNQVIHRDIKPANIIRRRDGKIVLIDFGGIKQVRARSADSTLLTAIIGTPGYMPIEQFNNNAHFCSDIHAVGMMGIFALTGIDADPRIGGFPKSPQGETLWRDKAQVSPQLADVIDQMVKFDYHQRYQSGKAVLAALKELLLANNWRCVRTLEGHSHYVNSVAFSPDGQILASGSSDKTIKLWQVSTGEESRTLNGHSCLVNFVAFSPDGQILASGSRDNTMKLWQVSTGEEIRTLNGGHSSFIFLEISPDWEIIPSLSEDEIIKLWQVSTGEEIRTLNGHSDIVHSVEFSPDGQILASGSYDNTIKLWQVNTGEEIGTLNDYSNWAVPLAFSPDGQILASGSEDYTIKLWQVSTGEEIRTLNGHSDIVNSVAFSPDGQILASGSYDKTIKLWQVSTGEEIRTLNDHSNWAVPLAFSPDGQILASHGEDYTIKLWQVSTGEEIRTLNGHSNMVSSVAFSPDGQILASCSWDNTIKLWQVSEGREICTLEGHSDFVWAVTFSPDGQILASSSHDETIKIWQRQ